MKTPLVPRVLFAVTVVGTATSAMFVAVRAIRRWCPEEYQWHAATAVGGAWGATCRWALGRLA